MIETLCMLAFFSSEPKLGQVVRHETTISLGGFGSSNHVHLPMYVYQFECVGVYRIDANHTDPEPCDHWQATVCFEPKTIDAAREEKPDEE